MQLPLSTTEELFCQNFKYFGLIILFLIALVFPSGYKQLRSFEKVINKIAYKKHLSVLLIGLLTFIGAASVSLIFSWPTPYVSDEFGYLLQADTFSNWRLTNPPHPMWQHFETIYVLQQPTYTSQYPFGQGLVLALGQILTGYPIVGVWISIALACASLCWMLQAWMPPRWALMGSFLMILKLGLFSYWSQSFWGGAVAATGGAIAFGALRRLVKAPQVSTSILLALGLGILANSRPYEGFIVSLPIFLYLFIWVRNKNSLPFELKFKKAVLPLVISLVFVVGIIGYYNWVVTGKAWVMPYQLYKSIYSDVSIFFWIKPSQPLQYNHKEFQMNRDMFYHLYQSHQNSLSLIMLSLQKLNYIFSFSLGVSFASLIFALPWLIKNYWVRFALLVNLLLILAILQLTFTYPHYIAPAICLIYFLALQCIRRIYVWRWRKKRVGALMAWAVILYSILLIVLPISLKADPYMFVNRAYWEIPKAYWPSGITKRQEIISKLSETKDRYLILIEYLPDHNLESEWVYNSADIDSAKIIWARSMGFEQNCKLIKYFSDRKVIFLKLGQEPDVIKSYQIIKACE